MRTINDGYVHTEPDGTGRNRLEPVPIGSKRSRVARECNFVGMFSRPIDNIKPVKAIFFATATGFLAFVTCFWRKAQRASCRHSCMNFSLTLWNSRATLHPPQHWEIVPPRGCSCQEISLVSRLKLSRWCGKEPIQVLKRELNRSKTVSKRVQNGPV